MSSSATACLVAGSAVEKIEDAGAPVGGFSGERGRARPEIRFLDKESREIGSMEWPTRHSDHPCFCAHKVVSWMKTMTAQMSVRTADRVSCHEYIYPILARDREVSARTEPEEALSGSGDSGAVGLPDKEIAGSCPIFRVLGPIN